MIGRKSRRPPVLHVSNPTREASPSAFSLCSDWDADDEGTMSSCENVPSRPSSVAIPAQPHPSAHCSRWPTLSEVLSNSAPPPWTLSAFMAYLSQNHCLETLEFTMDAGRYRSHFDEMAGPTTTSPQGREYVRMLWQRLLDAYIVPNGPREVNLPSNVRDRLLSLPYAYAPPPPDVLEPAVKIVYELMEESVLVPFLNNASRSGRDPSQPYPAPWRESPENSYTTHAGLDDRQSNTARSRRDSSPPVAMDMVNSSLSTNRRNNRSSPGASGVSSGSGDNLTDDSGGASSPGHEPMTPPTTPPTSDAGGMSPRQRHEARHDGNGTWKKMTGKLGWKKRPMGGRYPSMEDEGPLP